MLSQIINGWKNFVFKNKETEAMARSRAEICAVCDKAKVGWFEQIMPDYSIKNIQGLVCGECKCPLSTATRSEDYNCPLKKW